MVTVLTALIIASRGDDIHCTSSGPFDGKYIGWVTLGSEDRYRPLLESAPLYNSHEEAKTAMEALVAQIREKQGCQTSS